MKNNIPSASITRPPRQTNSNWQYFAAATICCAVLVAGFFLAARQHFSSMEYGFQNSRLRQQLDQLQSEKRRLMLNREISMSPVELRKAVKRIGFFDSPSPRAESGKTSNPSLQRSVTNTVEAVKSSVERSANKVMKTVINAPALKPSPDKQARREAPITKKDRT